MIVTSAPNLLDALASVNRVVDEKAATPILQHALVSVSPGSIKITGFCATMGVTVSVDATAGMSDAGHFLVSPSRLAQVVKASGGSEVTMERKEMKLAVVCGRGKYTLNLLDDEYPNQVDMNDRKATVSVSSKVLAAHMEAIKNFIAGEDNKYGLDGVSTEIGEGVIRLLATDGNALAVVDMPCAVDGAIPARSLLPVVAVTTIIKEIGKVDEPATLVLGDKSTVFTMSGTVLTFRMKEAEFPDYRQAVPPLSGNTVSADAAELIACIKAATPLMEGGGDVKGSLEWSVSDGTLTMRGMRAGEGDSLSSCAVESTKDTRFGISAERMAYALNALNSKVAIVDMGIGPLAPRRVYGEDKGRWFVVMPYRLVG